MQLMLIAGIVFAIGAVVFALQNNVLVTVTLAIWSVEGSLAVVLLAALGLGVLITCLLSTPTVIRGQWASRRLRRQLADLEGQVSDEQARNKALAGELERLTPSAPSGEAEKPYVGLRTLLTGDQEHPAA